MGADGQLVWATQTADGATDAHVDGGGDGYGDASKAGSGVGGGGGDASQWVDVDGVATLELGADTTQGHTAAPRNVYRRRGVQRPAMSAVQELDGVADRDRCVPWRVSVCNDIRGCGSCCASAAA
jgi:hypothetical protein